MGAPRSLDPYRRKRDPARTSEPFGIVAGRPPAPRPSASSSSGTPPAGCTGTLRLEIDGAPRQWAIPRGPSVDIKERRLAVQTEDHPIEYGRFEGLIPAGNYGAGAMILWDSGRYLLVDGLEPGAALASGKLDLELRGHKLRGRWALVRTKGEDGRQWLFFKKADAAAGGSEPVEAMPQSVVSGLTVTGLRTASAATPTSRRRPLPPGPRVRFCRRARCRRCSPTSSTIPSPAPAGCSSSSTTASAC
jgi:bifunctional non-homologous end joining protein LigD